MAIPDYQTIMLPLLKLTTDQNEHQFRDIVETLAHEFKLSQEERKTLLPSGTAFLFDNRVGWARVHLVKAMLLEKRERGFVKITQRGVQLIMQQPAKIDRKLLGQYPEFIEFVKPLRRGKTTRPISKAEDVSEQTPEEALEYGYQQIRNELVQQLLIQIKDASPKFFEKLVVELLVKMGYGGSIKDAGAVIGGSSDEGIDGVIKEDRLGLDTIYIQAKRWEDTTVSGSELQKFVGALEVKRANKGVFITTSNFAKSAKEYVERIGKQVVLIDGEELAELMIDYDIGVSRIVAYEIKRLDSDYFTEE